MANEKEEKKTEKKTEKNPGFSTIMGEDLWGKPKIKPEDEVPFPLKDGKAENKPAFRVGDILELKEGVPCFANKGDTFKCTAVYFDPVKQEFNYLLCDKFLVGEGNLVWSDKNLGRKNFGLTDAEFGKGADRLWRSMFGVGIGEPMPKKDAKPKTEATHAYTIKECHDKGISITCENPEESKALFEKMDSLGYRWASGQRYTLASTTTRTFLHFAAQGEVTLFPEWGRWVKGGTTPSIRFKDLASDKPELLDEAEKRYLKAVIRPWRRAATSIFKMHANENDYCIEIKLKTDSPVMLPWFKGEKTMYSGIATEKDYTLEELGL